MGETALITGAAGGFGKAIAERFITEGREVVLLDVEKEKLSQVARELADIGDVFEYHCDISDPDAVREIIKDVERAGGGLDVLVNNAGITRTSGVADTRIEEWKQVIDVNLTGTFICIRECLPGMINRGYGRIVNLSSIAAYQGGGYSGSPHYAASKAGVIGMTHSIAASVAGDGVTCNAVAPGICRTPITEQFLSDKDSERAVRKNIPVGRIGEPNDIARGVNFLAAKDSGYITGHTLVIDGGVSNRPPDA